MISEDLVAGLNIFADFFAKNAFSIAYWYILWMDLDGAWTVAGMYARMEQNTNTSGDGSLRRWGQCSCAFACVQKCAYVRLHACVLSAHVLLGMRMFVIELLDLICISSTFLACAT